MANLSQKFAALGNIRGMPIEDIKKRVGRPTSKSSTANGMLYQWMKFGIFGGYHYAISVDCDGKCIGYTHQHAKRLFSR